MRIARSAGLIGMAILGAAWHAGASCFLNSYCSNPNDREYDSSMCRSQRDRCDSQSSGTPPAPSRSYGAIAYSSGSGEYGYAEQFGSRAQAERRAMRECGKKDCEIAIWFYNSCGAVAADRKGIWGSAQGDNNQQAQKSAEARCAREGGKNCRTVYSHCSL